MSTETDAKRAKARARALRAAKVVTVAAAMAIAPTGCAMSHQRGDVDASRPPPVDSGTVSDAGSDGGRVLVDSGIDSGLADAGQDASSCPDPTFTSCCEVMPRHCCDAWGLGWDDAVGCCYTCVEGPLAPPSAPV